jgi:hypothetical protein
VGSDERPAEFRSDRERLRAILMILPAALLILCVVVLLLPTFLFGPLAGSAVAAVPPDAVRVTASAYPYGPVLVERTITNARVVRDLYIQLSRLPRFGGRVGCALARPDPISYAFRFTRWGAPVVVASPQADGCAPRRWGISSGGYGYTRLDETGATTRALLAEAGLPPLPAQG